MHTLVLLATGSVTQSLLLVEGVVALLAGIEKLQLSAAPRLCCDSLHLSTMGARYLPVKAFEVDVTHIRGTWW